jgi:hypothetical protein
MTMKLRGNSPVERATRWLAAFVSAGLAATAPVSAQSVAPLAAPAEWVAYATTATQTITGWLGADGETAIRFRAYLDGTRSSTDQPTPPPHSQSLD